ncbi:uncharacterized protein [Amphiura filiformis]|uniref:uncharacterized protein n=1 Tax=Amphiura filiformis TaxID=82378 RepID=UPI003B21A051
MATAGNWNGSILTDDEKEELSGYEFPFENVVFEAGGAKGIAYIGALRVLEEIGAMKKVRRFAGASAGSITAGLLAIGYTATELQGRLIDEDVPVHDGSWTKRLYYLFRKYGWYPGKDFNKWYSKLLEEKSGNADITFHQVYKKYEKELCIAVTNVNTMDVCYCHVKTTPDMPIREAVRMSMSIPGVFCAVKHQLYSSRSPDLFVDGAMLCSFPIHCYDGWYLSMKPEDSFLQRFASVSLKDVTSVWDRKRRFGEKNDKTLGFLLYSMHDPDVFQLDLQERQMQYCKEPPQDIPDTCLARKFKDDRKQIEEACHKHKELSTAMQQFLKVLAQNDIDSNGMISRDEFKKAMTEENSEFTQEHAKLIFGENYKVDEVFDSIDADNNQQITFRELIAFAEKQGLQLREMFSGHRRKKITDLKEHFSAIGRGLLLATKFVFISDDDVHRTAGIDTVYLETTSFEMDKEDKLFLVQQGKIGTVAYVRNYIVYKNLSKSGPSTEIKQQENGDQNFNNSASPEPEAEDEVTADDKEPEDTDLKEESSAAAMETDPLMSKDESEDK